MQRSITRQEERLWASVLDRTAMSVPTPRLREHCRREGEKCKSWRMGGGLSVLWTWQGHCSREPSPVMVTLPRSIPAWLGEEPMEAPPLAEELLAVHGCWGRKKFLVLQTLLSCHWVFPHPHTDRQHQMDSVSVRRGGGRWEQEVGRRMYCVALGRIRSVQKGGAWRDKNKLYTFLEFLKNK